MLLDSHRAFLHFLLSCLPRFFHKYWVLSLLILGSLGGSYSHTVNAQTFTLPATSTTGSYIITWSGTTSVGYIDENQNGTWVRVGTGGQSGAVNITRPISGTYTYRLQNCTAGPSGLTCVIVAGTKSINVTLASSSSSSATSAANTTIYRYDALGRLTFVVDAANGNRDYDYDAAGNRIEMNVGNAVDDAAPVTSTQPKEVYNISQEACYRSYSKVVRWSSSNGITGTCYFL